VFDADEAVLTDDEEDTADEIDEIESARANVGVL